MSDENASASGDMGIDAALVRQLAELLSETNLSEIEVADGERRIRVARLMAPQPQPATVALPQPAAGPAAPTAEALAAAAPAGKPVKSPMVGTAYLATDPSAAPFVRVGQSVAAGDTLLIIEAMKVMNPITAPFAGTVQAVLIDNGQPVEFDQSLVMIG